MNRLARWLDDLGFDRSGGWAFAATVMALLWLAYTWSSS
jgi:hypothetical protein